ncbi:MAG: hypothetical protein ACKOAO_01930 [Oxalobacteraceae bacterium]
MNRRTWLLSAAAMAAALIVPFRAAHAHSPYRQWDIFRKKHLQILTSRSDLEGDSIGDEWVALLLERLPLSQAMVSRARDMHRVASLLKTDQAKLAVLSHSDAKAIIAGASGFEEFRPIPLQILLDNGTHVLVARENLPLHHAYVVTATLLEEASPLHLRVPLDGQLGMSLHPGARSAALGEKLEMPPAEAA